MDARTRAWWAAKQGLDGSLAGATAHDVLARTGWMRTVGGAGPYLGLDARAFSLDAPESRAGRLAALRA
jgi:hypothetical protein